MNIFKNKNGEISSIITNIQFSYFKSNIKEYSQLMNKLTDEFVNMQLFEGDKLLEYGFDNDIYFGDDDILFKHSKGTALIRALSFGRKKDNGYRTEISPAVEVISSDFLGWTFSTGNFSDVHLIQHMNLLAFHTRDTIEIHNLYLHWVISELEKRFTGYKLDNTYTPLNRDVIKLLEIETPICNEFDEYIIRNKSKRIDSLIVNGKSVAKYIREEIKYRYCSSELDIYKCSVLYGKPYQQIKDYLNKILA